MNIIKIRKELGLTQQKFADLIGVDRRTVINYEQGKKIPESKTKLLELLLENKRNSLESKKTEGKDENTTSLKVENLNREVLDLKDHIKTLKDFLEEKNRMNEFYQAEIEKLKEELEVAKSN